MMTRPEYLAWCKARALEYVDAGDLPSALASMLSDLSERDDTRPVTLDNRVTTIGFGVALLNDATAMRLYIEAFK